MRLMVFGIPHLAPAPQQGALELARRRARRHHLRFRLAVLGVNVEDIVATAGGWICDRAMSGWEVTVATRDESENPEPLKMLGACGIGLGSADLERRGPWPHALAISPVLYESAEEVQSGVRRALRQGTPTITLLGTKTWPDGLENEMRLVQHPVSGGARRFKACALSALSSQRDAYEPEVFLSGELNTYTPWSHDLMPV